MPKDRWFKRRRILPAIVFKEIAARKQAEELTSPRISTRRVKALDSLLSRRKSSGPQVQYLCFLSARSSKSTSKPTATKSLNLPKMLMQGSSWAKEDEALLLEAMRIIPIKIAIISIIQIHPKEFKPITQLLEAQNNLISICCWERTTRQACFQKNSLTFCRAFNRRNKYQLQATTS